MRPKTITIPILNNLFFAEATAIIILLSLTNVIIETLHTNVAGIQLIRHLQKMESVPILELTCGDSSTEIDEQRISQIKPPNLIAALYAWIHSDCVSSETELTQFTESYPDHKVAWFWLGVVHTHLRHLKKAADAIKSAKAANYVVQLANTAKSRRDAEYLQLWLLVAAKTGDNIFPDVRKIAWTDYLVGRKVDAITFLQPYAEALPKNTVESWRALGFLERLKGEITTAIRYYEYGLQLNPNDLELIYYLRSLYLDIEEYDKALQLAYREAKLDPDKLYTSLTLARINRLRGDFAQARKFAELAIEINPDSWTAYVELGRINCLHKREKIAFSNFDTALTLAPYEIDILSAKATCFYQLGDSTQAIYLAERVIKQYGNDPKLIDLYLSLGNWYTDLHDIPKAKSLYEQGMQLWPNAHWIQERLDSFR